MATQSQVQAAKAILNIFETASVLGDYGSVTVIPGDTGLLTFGRSQTTLGSGNLADLMERYTSNPGARFAARLKPWLDRIRQRDRTLNDEQHLHNLLRATADDRVMRDVQDEFFDDVYWQPAMRSAQRIGISTPLGLAVVYDGVLHGSWDTIRRRTEDKKGSVVALGERAWVEAYVRVRGEWLATHPRKDLRATVYRMTAFLRLIELGKWGLELPLVVRGFEISELTLNAAPKGSYEGPEPGTRALALQQPLARGLDVRLMQLGLSASGANIRADAVFGSATREALLALQASKGLPVTGAATAELVASLAMA
jgi:chitosanase